MENLVMIIDDSQTTRRILEVCLRRVDVHSISYGSGLEALSALQDQPSLIPAVVILDVGLPTMDGYTVARCLRTRPEFDQTAIIMLSGHNTTVDRIWGRIAGATTYIAKPFKTKHIVSVVSSHLQARCS
jgi:DNA-binding response OmpR family regulator